MHIKPFRATYPVFDRIASSDAFCAAAKNEYLDYKRQGLLTRTQREGLYVYQIEDAHRRHTGLVTLNDVRDFFSGKVKKHEKTLSEREQRQMDLFLHWGAILKPILLTHPPVPTIGAWLQQFVAEHAPLFETHFSEGEQTHRVWEITHRDDIQLLQDLFAAHIPGVYIADGHHRTSTMAYLHQQLKQSYPHLDFDHLFCAFFSTDQLDILDYNRVVEGLNGLTPEQFLGRVAEIAELEPIENPRKPRRKFELKMLLNDQWYRLHWRTPVVEAPPLHPLPPALLDVSLLNELVLHRLLGIVDIRTDARINYVEGSKGLKGIAKAVKGHPDGVGFALHPVSFDDMMRMADAGESLPPKSTYFAPRMPSGMLIHTL